MVEYMVPDWIMREAIKWGRRMGLDNWTIGFEVVQVFNQGPYVAGACSANAQRREATVRFRSDLDNNDEGRIIVVHELKHVDTARMDQAVEEEIIPLLPTAAQALARTVWNNALEEYVDHNAKTLYALDRRIEELERELKRAKRKAPRTGKPDQGNGSAVRGRKQGGNRAKQAGN